MRVLLGRFTVTPGAAVASGIDLREGDDVEIVATGVLSASVRGLVTIDVVTGPDGLVVVPGGLLVPEPSFRPLALLCRIGGVAGQAGSMVRFRAWATGALQLEVNAFATTPSQGAYEVEVYRREAEQSDPIFAVGGIQVNQAIQTPYNEVPLVAGRGAVVRAMLVSRRRDGADLGAGPNVVPEVTGILEIQDEDGNGLAVRVPALTATAPARPEGANLDQWAETLNFTVPPSLCHGRRTFVVLAFRPGDTAEIVTGTTTVVFETRPVQPITPVLLADTTRGLPAPTMAQWTAELAGAVARFPIAADGLRINPPFVYATWLLGSLDGWGLLVSALSGYALWGAATPTDGIRAGLAPAGSAIPAAGGIGLPRIGLLNPAFFLPAGGVPFSRATFAHEFGHALGFLHLNAGGAPCPWESGPVVTEATGVDITRAGSIAGVSGPHTVPRGSSELMTYSPAPVWASIDRYVRAFRMGPV